MAEFQEVMREWVRSRKAINENKLSCCPLEMFTDDYIANIENEVMSWAAEHPEPVYPRWVDWLVKVGVLGRETRQGHDSHFVEEAMFEPIPADIAQKLGIEPK